MTRLHDRLGVAVEADAARYSGEMFASARGTSIAARVRRRRAVRAAGYGGGAMLAVGALAVGGTRLPWEALSAGLNVGGNDCVSASPSAATGTGPTSLSSIVTAELDGSELAFTDAASGEVMTFRIVDGGVISTDGGGTSWLRQHEDGTYSFELADGSYVSFVVAEGQGSVEVISVDTLEPSYGPLPASPSADCVTAEPSTGISEGPAPEPSWGGELEVMPREVSSPFQCGFVFPASVGSTGVIAVEAPRWLTPADAEEEIRSEYADPDAVLLQLSGDDVPVVEFATTTAWADDRETWILMQTDPALEQAGILGGSNGSPHDSGFLLSAQYVLEADDTVIATLHPTTLPDGAASQYTESRGRTRAIILGLDLTSGFTMCPGVDPAEAEGAQAVAVAGTLAFDADGTQDGPHYAWRYITRA